ncbi:GNAT family N-acetyltransferase [Kocuria palustris]|uniref:GNAT family N-acetyltransferase n=1 Tax=Kocuria palustris TaxID=71999 RepID=UPI0021A391D8|nr:GNAT family N-acetyltransferase [Kocuria palustris]MCT1589916.1 N-acetyltransferase [Kocuria palustris]
MAELSFRTDDGPQRYEALSGDAIAGKMYWVDASEAEQPERIFFHTEVDDAFEGQGVASQLVRFAVDDAIERGFRIVPVCPYVKAWLKRHDDYAQHAVAVRPRHLEAVQARQRRSS